MVRLLKDSHIIKTQFKNEYLPKKIKDREKPKNQIKEYKKEISKHLKDIDRLKENKVELFRKKLLLDIDEKSFKRIETDIDSKIYDLSEKIIDIENNISGIQKNIKWFDWLEDFEKHFEKISEYKSIEDKRRFLKKYVNRIEVTYNTTNKTHHIKIFFKFHLVNDKRIRKEKYKFEVLNGQNYSEIGGVNSQKIKHLLNKGKIPKHYSKITQLSPTKFRLKYLKENDESKNDVYQLTLTFNFNIISSNLTKSSVYNSYQNKLYRLVKFLKEERGIGYRRISHILTEKGYKSVRTNSQLKGTFIYSIYKKGKIREERINQSFDSYIDDLKYKIREIS